jgi:hypothetical protein
LSIRSFEIIKKGAEVVGVRANGVRRVSLFKFEIIREVKDKGIQNESFPQMYLIWLKKATKSRRYRRDHKARPDDQSDGDQAGHEEDLFRKIAF